MKSLVIYYSLTGNTKLVAQVVAEALNATQVEITESKTRKIKPLVYLIGGFEATMNRASRINAIDVDLKQYDRIFIGSPTWNSRPTPAINSFVYQADFEGVGVIPFFTMGGDSADKALENITAKIEKNQGKIAGFFAIKSHKVSREQLISRTKAATKKYSS